MDFFFDFLEGVYALGAVDLYFHAVWKVLFWKVFFGTLERALALFAEIKIFFIEDFLFDKFGLSMGFLALRTLFRFYY